MRKKSKKASNKNKGFTWTGWVKAHNVGTYNLLPGLKAIQSPTRFEETRRLMNENPAVFREPSRLSIIWNCWIRSRHVWEDSGDRYFYNERCARCGVPRQ